MPGTQLLYLATAAFQAARRLRTPAEGHRLRRWHGHDFEARIEASLPPGWGGFLGAELDALCSRMGEAVAQLDYSDLAEHLAEPSDSRLAAWIAQHAAVPGWTALTLRSAPEQRVVVEANGKTLLARRYGFEAAHRLPNVPPEHQCSRMHGHGFVVTLCAPLHDLPEWDVAATLDRVWQQIGDRLDHACLNDIEDLGNPTSELISAWVWRRVSEAGVALAHVDVAETATTGSRFDGERFAIWKDQRFDAATRVANAPAADRRANLHGHSYMTRLTLSAQLVPVLGWLVDFGDVKSLFAPIYRVLDHHRLDGLEGLRHADCAGVVQWIREQAGPLLPQLAGIDLYERPGCGTRLSWRPAP